MKKYPAIALLLGLGFMIPALQADVINVDLTERSSTQLDFSFSSTDIALIEPGVVGLQVPDVWAASFYLPGNYFGLPSANGSYTLFVPTPGGPVAWVEWGEPESGLVNQLVVGAQYINGSPLHNDQTLVAISFLSDQASFASRGYPSWALSLSDGDVVTFSELDNAFHHGPLSNTLNIRVHDLGDVSHGVPDTGSAWLLLLIGLVPLALTRILIPARVRCR